MLETVTKENFNQLLGRFSTSELETITDKFPYFHQAHLLLAKRYQQENNPKFDKQLQLAVLYTQDREFLFSLFNEKDIITPVEAPVTLIKPVIEQKVETQELVEIEIKKEIVEEAATEKPTLTETNKEQLREEIATEEDREEVKETFAFNQPHTFDEWLDILNKPGSHRIEVIEEPVAEKQDDELGQLIMSNLHLHELVEEETQYSKGLDKFIEEQKLKHKPQETKTSSNENELAPELITETIAKVYVAQKKYAKAIRAYEILTLKYPEKNDFFATRITELKNII